MKTWTPTDDPADIVVPGLDPSAPYEDQIELLDQLITLKLQQTDEHWAAIHNMIINELLPSVKRYSQNSQPTREAAHFWKTFYETAANIQLPNPGGEPSNAGHAEEEAAEEPAEDEEEHAEASYSSDYTPVDHSFNPAVASTPGRPLGGALDMYRSDADTTGTSTASSFPNFSAPQYPSDADESSFGDSPSEQGLDVKGEGRAIDESTTTSTSISHSSANIFTVSPAKPRKSKGKTELREQLLRQKHKQAATPIRAKNPFRKSTVPTPHGDVVDLSRYSPSSSDATIQLDLSPSVKLKAFSTPQYKLALRTKEDAVAIQMSEARARASDYSSSDDFSAPPTPMNASRRAKQQKDERAELQARFDRDMARSAGLLPSDGSSDEDDGPDNAVSDSDSDSFINDDSPGGSGLREGDSFDSGTFQLEGMGDQSNLMQGSVAHNADSDSDSFVERDRFDLEDLDDALDEPVANAPAQATGTHLSYDDTDGYSGASSSHALDHTGPTETIFGVRPADKLISQADWERKLSRPLPGRVLPDQPFDSPTPADPAGSKRTSGPSKGRY